MSVSCYGHTKAPDVFRSADISYLVWFQTNLLHYKITICICNGIYSIPLTGDCNVTKLQWNTWGAGKYES
jgi:hypothetical protein